MCNTAQWGSHTLKKRLKRTSREGMTSKDSSTVRMAATSIHTGINLMQRGMMNLVDIMIMMKKDMLTMFLVKDMSRSITVVMQVMTLSMSMEMKTILRMMKINLMNS